VFLQAPKIHTFLERGEEDSDDFDLERIFLPIPGLPPLE